MPGQLPPREQAARRIHLAVGAAAVVLALAHEATVFATRHGIKPYSTLGWLPERLFIGFAPLLTGVWILISLRTLPRLFHPLLSAAMLGALSFTLFLRYFSPMTALFSVAGFADAFGIAIVFGQGATRVVMAGLCFAALAGVSLFLIASYTGAGA